MNTEKILEILTDTEGISGFEENAARVAMNMLLPLCDEVYENRYKSVIGVIKSKQKDPKKLMIEAHLDKIGLMVSSIEKGGFVKVDTVGGVDLRILPASEVYILGKEKIYGVLGALPPHLKSAEDKAKMPKISELLVDTGGREDLAEKISPGDAVLMKNRLTPLSGGEYFAPAMDNRAGITAILKGIETLSNSPYDVYVVFSSEEEIGLHGASCAAWEIRPDIGVVVDVTHGMTPDTKDEAGVFKTGCGCVICRGSNFDDCLAKRAIFLARDNGIKYEIEAAADHSGTNAWTVQTAGGGVKTVLLSIPVKYMHTSVETLDLSDIEDTSRLIKLILEGGLENA